MQVNISEIIASATQAETAVENSTQLLVEEAVSKTYTVLNSHDLRPSVLAMI